MKKEVKEKAVERRLTRKPKLATARDFWSFLKKSDLTDQKRKELFAQSQAHPMALLDPDRRLDTYKLTALLEWLKKYIEWLRTTPYTVTIENATTETFSDVVWAYQLRDGTVGLEYQLNLSPGAFAIFNYPSCLQMVSYAFSIYVANVEVIRSTTMTVGEINTMEARVHGQFSMCEDSWSITEE